jgi:hypothetical protein
MRSIPGRLDQHLYPFYKNDIEAGRLTEEQARELLCAFWIKFNNHPAPPKTGVTAKESNTYVDFALINVGGVKANGGDAVNDLSYLILDVIEEMRLLQPSSMVQLSKKNPDRFIKRALKIVKTGFGQPSIFNTDAIVQDWCTRAKPSRTPGGRRQRLCRSRGVRPGGLFSDRLLQPAQGAGNHLEQRGRPANRQTVGPRNRRSRANSADFEALFDAWTRQLNHFIDIKIRATTSSSRSMPDRCRCLSIPAHR